MRMILQGKMTSSRWRGAALCGLLVCGTGGTALAQQQQADDPDRTSAAGGRSTITTGIGVEAGNNLDLVEGLDKKQTRVTGNFAYLYELQTRQTMLSFSAQIQPETDNSNNSGLYPDLDLKMVHEAPRTRVKFDASYAEARITDQGLGFDANTGAIIEYDGAGTRTMKTLSTGVEGGIDMPLGYSLSFEHNEIGYRDLSQESAYYGSSRNGVKGGLRADVSSMTSLSLNTEYSLYKAENTDHLRRTTDSISFGIDQRIDGLTSVMASTGYQQVDTKRAIRGDETTDGAIFALGLKRDDQLGSYQVSYDRSITETGTRDELLVGRDRETQMGKFSGTVGVSKGQEGGTDWIGSLAYKTELPRDTLTAELQRSVRTDDDGDDVVVTRIKGRVVHSLSDVNALDFGVTASSTEYSTRDALRVDATVSYQHLLARDVNLQAGVRMELSQKSSEDDVDSQSFFLTLSRQFRFLH